MKSHDHALRYRSEVSLCAFNEEDKKISLSIKAMFAAEASAEPEGDEVSVDIDAVIAAQEEDGEQ